MDTGVPYRGDGFTRVDVVALLATVCILTAVPIGAVFRNAETSSVAVDLSNTRQILAAANLYAAQNDDRLPHPTWGTVPGGPDGWAYATQNRGRLPGLPSSIPNLAGVFDNSAQLPWVEKGQIAPYLQSFRVLECPEDVRERSDGRYRELYTQRPVKITSYNWNGAVCGFGGSAPLFTGVYRLSDFQGTDLLQWEGNEAVPFNFNDAGANPAHAAEGISQRHLWGTPHVGAPNEAGGGGVAGYFGGHAKVLRYHTFAEMRESEAPNPIRCGPGFE